MPDINAELGPQGWTMKPYYDADGITLYCGDCLDVLPRLELRANLLITDPPYGTEWRSGRRAQAFDFIQGDRPADQPAVLEALRLALGVLQTGCHVYIFGSLDVSALRLGSTAELIWDKCNMGSGDLSQPWAPQHERIMFAVYVLSRVARGKGQGGLPARMRRGSVLRVPRPVGAGVTRHPTEKPVLLLRQLIESSSVIGDLVLDPFAGAGSTLVAARVEERRAVGIEIEERYCERAAERLRQGVFNFAEPAPCLT